MNQQKIGEVLKQLRKEKGLTQQQLADQFHTTNRSVSRWETGNALPDISVLIELAEFYDVELIDILSAQKKETMNQEVKETAVLVGEYCDEKKQRLTKVFHWLCIASLVGLVGNLVIETLSLQSGVWDFLKGLGIGLSLGSLAIGVIYTSKLSTKLFGSAK